MARVSRKDVIGSAFVNAGQRCSALRVLYLQSDMRYRARDLEKLLNEINDTGYGLTLGIHSRIEKTQDAIVKTASVENCYSNRTVKKFDPEIVSQRYLTAVNRDF